MIYDETPTTFYTRTEPEPSVVYVDRNPTEAERVKVESLKAEQQHLDKLLETTRSKKAQEQQAVQKLITDKEKEHAELKKVKETVQEETKEIYQTLEDQKTAIEISIQTKKDVYDDLGKSIATRTGGYQQLVDEDVSLRAEQYELKKINDQLRIENITLASEIAQKKVLKRNLEQEIEKFTLKLKELSQATGLFSPLLSNDLDIDKFLAEEDSSGDSKLEAKLKETTGNKKTDENVETGYLGGEDQSNGLLPSASSLWIPRGDFEGMTTGRSFNQFQPTGSTTERQLSSTLASTSSSSSSRASSSHRTTDSNLNVRDQISAAAARTVGSPGITAPKRTQQPEPKNKSNQTEKLNLFTLD